jgi:hypothetical protein
MVLPGVVSEAILQHHIFESIPCGGPARFAQTDGKSLLKPLTETG